MLASCTTAQCYHSLYLFASLLKYLPLFLGQVLIPSGLLFLSRSSLSILNVLVILMFRLHCSYQDSHKSSFLVVLLTALTPASFLHWIILL